MAQVSAVRVLGRAGAACMAVLMVGCATPLEVSPPPAAASDPPPPRSSVVPWPAELPAVLPANATRFVVPESNYAIDFHGSAQNPDLVLFMAGNQYRALPELVAAFRTWAKATPSYAGLKTDNIFYATLPPGRLIDAMQSGKLLIGNYWFEVAPGKLWPDAFMTGPRQQKRLKDLGYIDHYSLYARNRGAVLLVRKGNPLNIRSVTDLARDDVRVAISSPKREPASFESYANTLRAQGGAELPARVLAKTSTVSPAAVHHRENAQFVFDGRADVAPMYQHFGSYLKTALPEAFDYVPLPREGNFIDTLGISLIKPADRPRAAAAWLEFMRTDIAAAIYEKNEFTYATPAERVAIVVP
jgi:hypothetical protein